VQVLMPLAGLQLSGVKACTDVTTKFVLGRMHSTQGLPDLDIAWPRSLDIAAGSDMSSIL